MKIGSFFLEESVGGRFFIIFFRRTYLWLIITIFSDLQYMDIITPLFNPFSSIRHGYIKFQSVMFACPHAHYMKFSQASAPAELSSAQHSTLWAKKFCWQPPLPHPTTAPSSTTTLGWTVETLAKAVLAFGFRFPTLR
jgi:hypothetical protein